jgi:tetratricopeptide (TPR) repeat protein
MVSLPCPSSGQQAPLDPASPIITKVQKLIQDGNFTAARRELLQGLRDFPNDGPLYGLMGVVEASVGNYASAEANFKKAITLIPRFAGTYLDLGRLYQENVTKDPQAARKGLETYEALLRIQPDNREALFQSAFLLEYLGRFRASLDRLSQLSAADRESPQALAVKCASLAGLGEREEAGAAASQLLQNPQTTESDLLQLLPALEAHNANDLAERLLLTLTERQGSYKTFYALGLLEKQRGDLVKARQALEQATRYRPSDVPLLLDLARVAFAQKDWKGTFGYLAHARNIQPQNASIHYFWGMVSLQEKLVEEAFKALRRAVQLDPENPLYNLVLGYVAIQRVDASESVPYFAKYRKLRPDDPRGMLGLGAAYVESFEIEKGKPELTKAAQYRETAAGAHYYLARIANKKGDYLEAREELAASLQANPNSAETYGELGSTYIKLKDYAQAEKALHKALELQPESYTANLNLTILYQRTKDPRAQEQAERFQQIKEKWDKSRLEMLRTVQVVP